jgi:phosphocarrier protein HPr
VKQRDVVIGHRLGLHARSASKLVQLSTQFESNIILSRPDVNAPLADARSILSILLLSAGFGSKVNVQAEGVDEDQAIKSICEYLSG